MEADLRKVHEVEVEWWKRSRCRVEKSRREVERSGGKSER